MSHEIEEPGPEQATAAYLDKLREEIARRNEQAHQNARELLTNERARIAAEREPE